MDQSRLEIALQLAASAHSGQVRDGKFPLPYLTHPVDVVNNLRYIGEVTDEALLAAGLLHDVVEETEVTLDEIERLLGAEVAGLVKEVTRYEPTESERDGLDKHEIWELRSNHLLGEIRQMSERAQTLKLADRLSNLRQAKVTRSHDKWLRYCQQTEDILSIIPKTVNSRLWEAVQSEI